MEHIHCNHCGSADQSFVYRRPDGMYFKDEWFDVVECDHCGLGFVNPRPTAEEIARFYQAEYYDGLVDVDHTARYHAQAQWLPAVDASDAPPVLLDIGCGAGDFPRFMANADWRVEGVEPFCKVPIDDFPVHRRFFPELTDVENRYDAITAWAVLEHVHDPMAYFMKAGQALKPGGVFVFLVTNFDGLSSKRLFQEDLPRHLHFFTKRTVESYLAKAGMTLETSEYGDSIVSMGARGAMNYFFTRYVKRRPYAWADRPADFPGFLARHNMKRSLFSALAFAVRHPVSCLDHFAEPWVDRFQKMTDSYGIVTYKARKVGDV